MIVSIAAIAWGLAVNLMIAAGAIAWHDAHAFAAVTLASMMAFVCFVMQIQWPEARGPQMAYIMAYIMAASWILSVLALLRILANS